MKENGSLIVSWDFSHGKDATEIYEKLTTVKKKENPV